MTYADFIEACRLKTPERGEWHHVVPTSCGGTDDPSNRIFLSHRDHLEAHWLFSNETGKCWNALRWMLGKKRSTLTRMDETDRSELFERHAMMREIAFSQPRVSRPVSDEVKQRISASMRGKAKSSEHAAAISKGKTGKPRSEAAKAAISAGAKRRAEALRCAAEGRPCPAEQPSAS